jgi:hypothetical protein
MTDRLQEIREAVVRDVANSENAYADRAWLLAEYDRLSLCLSEIVLAVDAAAVQCDLLPIFETPAKKIQALADLAQSYKEDYEESCGALRKANERAAKAVINANAKFERRMKAELATRDAQPGVPK